MAQLKAARSEGCAAPHPHRPGRHIAAPGWAGLGAASAPFSALTEGLAMQWALREATKPTDCTSAGLSKDPADAQKAYGQKKAQID
jgi:hypothetical protein